MRNDSIRTLVCVFVGLFAGGVLGALFVPNPTGLLAFALSSGVAVLVGGGLYRSDWRRDSAN